MWQPVLAGVCSPVEVNYDPMPEVRVLNNGEYVGTLKRNIFDLLPAVDRTEKVKLT